VLICADILDMASHTHDQAAIRKVMVGPGEKGSCHSARRVVEHGDWAAKEEVSKQKKKEDIPAVYQQEGEHR
jgi:hypothetical protein